MRLTLEPFSIFQFCQKDEIQGSRDRVWIDFFMHFGDTWDQVGLHLGALGVTGVSFRLLCFLKDFGAEDQIQIK